METTERTTGMTTAMTTVGTSFDMTTGQENSTKFEFSSGLSKTGSLTNPNFTKGRTSEDFQTGYDEQKDELL